MPPQKRRELPFSAPWSGSCGLVFLQLFCVYWRCLDVSDVVETPQLSQLSTADALITTSHPNGSIGAGLSLRMKRMFFVNFIHVNAFGTGVRRSVANRV